MRGHDDHHSTGDGNDDRARDPVDGSLRHVSSGIVRHVSIIRPVMALRHDDCAVQRNGIWTRPEGCRIASSASFLRIVHTYIIIIIVDFSHHGPICARSLLFASLSSRRCSRRCTRIRRDVAVAVVAPAIRSVPLNRSSRSSLPSHIVSLPTPKTKTQRPGTPGMTPGGDGVRLSRVHRSGRDMT